MEKRCRICLGSDDILHKSCNCTDVCMHLECAAQWYKYKIQGYMEGYAHNREDWIVHWYIVCEVCKQILNPVFTKFAMYRLHNPKVIKTIKNSYFYKKIYNI